MAEEQLRPLTKSEKAAILFLCMDEKTTSDLFGQMQDEEIRKIANALLHINQIPTVQIQGVVEEFSKGYSTSKEKLAHDIPVDGGKAVENMLARSLTRGRSQNILASIRQPNSFAKTSSSDTNLADFLMQYPVDDIAELLLQEHPQIIAIILVNLKKKQSKLILEKFTEEQQVDIIARMAGITKIPNQMLTELKEYIGAKLSKKASGGNEEAKAKEKKKELPIEGLMDTVKVLKAFKRDVSMKLVSIIEKTDPEIGIAISKQMFTMEDLERADDVGIRELLRGIANEDLKIALKNSPDAVKERFFTNMSSRAALILREDMEVMPPLKVEDVEIAQENILKVARDLIKEEKLKLTDIVDESEE